MKRNFKSVNNCCIAISMLTLVIGMKAHAETKASTTASGEAVKALATKVEKSLRLIKGGTFEMGDWGNEDGVPYDFEKDSRPLHKVTLDTFLMAAYKVSYEDFDIFTDATGNERVDMEEFVMRYRAPKRPAGVNWYGAKNYCQWLAKITKLPFDLPTEAQWEYAARSGGKRTLFATDNGQMELGRNHPPEWKYGQPKPSLPDVGSYPSNPAGLYGMSELTGEWVNDWYDENYYQLSPKKNPQGPKTGTKKVLRGSVGGNPLIAAMVFMRGSLGEPRTMKKQFTGDPHDDIPYPGYSSTPGHNFRCVVNAKYLIHIN